MNKQTHQFIFSPGTWIGEGKITFSTSPQSIHFYTKWMIESHNQGFFCSHQVEMQGADESMFNKLTISDVTPTSFLVTLENNLVGRVAGKGVIDPKTIAWEYRQGDDFEGFEVYELQEDGDYMLHAEYSSSDQYRTIIDGRIWKKSS